jgi:beta-lactamase superfamily II metal-dependent hydrolase
MSRFLFAAVVLAALSACWNPDTTLPEQVLPAEVFKEKTSGPVCLPQDLLLDEPDVFLAHFIDVGQGDAIWMRLPTGDPSEPLDVLVDAGGRPRFPGDQAPDAGLIIASYMEDHGLVPGSDLDWLVITHGDVDHYGGVQSLLESYGVLNFAGQDVIGSGNDWGLVWEQIRAQVEQAGGVFASPVMPGLAPFPGGNAAAMATPFAAVRVLWPPNPLGIFKGEPRNSLAAVLHVEVHGVRLLLTGDVEGESEAELVRMSEAGMVSLASEILKVAHHGSNTSSSDAFLNRVWSAVAEGERYAVVQSGRESFNGTTLPTSDIVERLHGWTGAGHLLSTQHADEEKSSSEAAGDDHVVLRVDPGGNTRLCYNPGLGVTGQPGSGEPDGEDEDNEVIEE